MLPRICLTEMGFHATAQTVQNNQPEEDENHIMLTIDQTLLYYSYYTILSNTIHQALNINTIIVRKLLWLDAAF